MVGTTEKWEDGKGIILFVLDKKENVRDEGFLPRLTKPNLSKLDRRGDGKQGQFGYSKFDSKTSKKFLILRAKH